MIRKIKIRLFFFWMCFLSFPPVIAQAALLKKVTGDIKKVTEETKKNEIIIHYDLESQNRLYKVELYFSKDNGATFHKATSVSGDVGEKVLSGRNKKIKWHPNYGLIGNIKFKIEATPISKSSVGISYVFKSFPIEYEGETKNIPHYSFHLNTFFSLKNGGNFLLPLGLIYTNQERDQHSFAVTLGYGYQTSKRFFSIYFDAGIEFGKGEVYRSGQYDGVESFESLLIDSGISFRLIDTKPITLLMPLEFYFSGGFGYSSLSTGIAVQF